MTLEACFRPFLAGRPHSPRTAVSDRRDQLVLVPQIRFQAHTTPPGGPFDEHQSVRRPENRFGVHVDTQTATHGLERNAILELCFLSGRE